MRTKRSLIFLISSLLILASMPLIADDKANKEFLAEATREFREKCEGEKGVEYLNCRAKHSPEKCKSLVYGKDRTAWSRCVYSCGSAGIISKTFGECSD